MSVARRSASSAFGALPHPHTCGTDHVFYEPLVIQAKSPVG